MSRSREQDRQYQRDRRLRIAAEQHEAAAGTVPESESAVALVRAELDTLPQSAKMPAAVAGALAMARVLDDPAAVPQHPAAAGQLRQIMAEIRATHIPDAKGSSLAQMRAAAMARREGRTS